MKKIVFSTQFVSSSTQLGYGLGGIRFLSLGAVILARKVRKFSAQRSLIYNKSFKFPEKKGMSASPVLKIIKNILKHYILDLVDFLISSTESWSFQESLKLKGNDINY